MKICCRKYDYCEYNNHIFEGDGPCSIITDGKDGFLVKDRNIHAFADRICQLIADRELRLRMGQAAVQSAQHYSADRIMLQWKQLFESLRV
ncbi:MAG: glycosyltransferase [Prevotella sp.]|nr:glycosyltransferase [Prevotella sp.]